MTGSVASSLKGVYRALRLVCPFFLILSIFISPHNSCAFEGGADALVAKARQERLHEDPYWRILLHYKPDLMGRLRSLVDDPRFFLSPKGKTDPEAELDADIRALFAGDGKDSARRRFPARYEWLAERLHLDSPDPPFGELKEALAKVNPISASLVFPVGYMNNPASMFGHTLLRIESGSESDLLAYAVNYAASTGETSGITYAFKGVFGYYPGYFSMLPYYAKVKEYSDLEHRDMWEYRLNLSPAEVRRMFLHIWELKEIYSDYYFFDENCSYNLLFLLEAGRPSLSLTDRLRYWVIPSDTLRVVRDSGLIREVRYRPSQGTRMRRMAAALDGAGMQMTRQTADGHVAANAILEKDLPDGDKTHILDLAAELLQYRYGRGEVEMAPYRKRFLSVLQARSALGRPDADPYPLERPSEPEEGHRSIKVAMGVGYGNRELFTEVGLRPSYHDLADPDQGYIKGSQISFLDTRLRYYPQKDRLRLESLRLIDIVSLSPRDSLFTPVSWKVATGFDRKLFNNGEERLIYRLNSGGGFAWDSGLLGLSYLMLETDLNLGDRLMDWFAVGLGASAGIQKNISSWWKANLRGEALFYEPSGGHRVYRGGLSQNFRVGRNNSVEVDIWREKSFDRYRSEVKALWKYYF